MVHPHFGAPFTVKRQAANSPRDRSLLANSRRAMTMAATASGHPNSARPGILDLDLRTMPAMSACSSIYTTSQKATIFMGSHPLRIMTPDWNLVGDRKEQLDKHKYGIKSSFRVFALCTLVGPQQGYFGSSSAAQLPLKRNHAGFTGQGLSSPWYIVQS